MIVSVGPEQGVVPLEQNNETATSFRASLVQNGRMICNLPDHLSRTTSFSTTTSHPTNYVCNLEGSLVLCYMEAWKYLVTAGDSQLLHSLSDDKLEP